MKIAVVILNWNTKDYLRRFLPPLLDSVSWFNAGETEDWAEVIVADSASADGSIEMLSRDFPKVRRIPLDRNYGFTGGYNRALKELSVNTAETGTPDSARELGSRGDFDLFILLNSDIEVTQIWLRPLAE